MSSNTANAKTFLFKDIGTQGTSKKANLVGKWYLGLDFFWVMRTFKQPENDIVRIGSFFRRFGNLSVDIGYRFHKNFAFEGGYIHYSNIFGTKEVGNTEYLYSTRLHGGYFDLIAYTNPLITKSTTFEAYASAGATMSGLTTGGGKVFFGGKFGVGIQATIYKALAVRAGVEYNIYQKNNNFVNKNGLLTFKTGFLVYF